MQVRRVPVVEPKKPDPPKPKPAAVANTVPVKQEATAQTWPPGYGRPTVPYYGPWGYASSYPAGYQPAGYWTYQPGPLPQPGTVTPSPTTTTTPDKAVDKPAKLVDADTVEVTKPAKALTKEEEIGQLAGKWITQFLQKNPEMAEAIPPDVIKALKNGNLSPEKLQEVVTQLLMQKNGLGSLGTGLQNNWLTNNWVSRKFVMPWAKWGVRQVMPPGTGGLSDKLFDTVMKPSAN